jgi:hypothetical protein
MKKGSSFTKKKKSSKKRSMISKKDSEKHIKALSVSKGVSSSGRGPVNTGQATTIKNPPQFNKSFFKKAYQGKG